MVLPFMLMASMATTSEGDFREFKLVPDYWTNDTALFRKVIVDAAKLDQTSVWAGSDHWFSPTDLRDEDLKKLTEMPAEIRHRQAEDVAHFIDTVCPPKFKMALYGPNPDSPFSARNAYRQWLARKYVTIEAANRAQSDNAATWEEFEMPEEPTSRLPQATPRVSDYRSWVESLPADRLMVFNANADVATFLRGTKLPPGFEKTNIATITFDDLSRAPFPRETLKRFFVERAAMRFAKIDVQLAATSWAKYLADTPEAPRVNLSPRMPNSPTEASSWAKFVQGDCPVEALSMDRPEDYWREMLVAQFGGLSGINQRYRTSYSSLQDVPIPFLEFQYDHFLKQKESVRKAYLMHNFQTVVQFVAVHGGALWNTLWLIIITIVGTLTVNPMAAYALSRFRLRESHQVLVFLLATMAFPAEVLMIPGFLQIKQFPVAAIIGAFLTMVGLVFLSKYVRGLNAVIKVTLAGVLTVLVAGYLSPLLASSLGMAPDVSLMNTFWALSLPGLASGFGIFLLKGFFDSLPPELYEAGLLDGAGEMTMFSRITLPLCKPILAVMALGSFTGAYGAFMHAFLVAQDPRMWTRMVFLYEFQQSRSLPMVMASLVIAAIPTLIMFVLCQRVILRGIVIPTYK
jgi:ABC-type glycerol-3-phosphate transport system permease component